MAEMAQQTPLVIEVDTFQTLTNEEKTKIRRAAVRGNGLNIVLSADNTQSRVICCHCEKEIGSSVDITYFDWADSESVILTDCGEVTAEDLSDDSPAE